MRGHVQRAERSVLGSLLRYLGVMPRPAPTHCGRVDRRAIDVACRVMRRVRAGFGRRTGRIVDGGRKCRARIQVDDQKRCSETWRNSGHGSGHGSAYLSGGVPGPHLRDPRHLSRASSVSRLSADRAQSCRMEHEAEVEPAFKARRGYRQPTARVLDQAAGIGPAWAAKLFDRHRVRHGNKNR